MPRLKRTVTAKRLAANRSAALKSTGPRTTAGKQRSSLNALREGNRSKMMALLWHIILEAPAGGVITVARELMSRVQLSRPEVAYMLNLSLAPGDVPIGPEKDGPANGTENDLSDFDLNLAVVDSEGLIGFGLALADADSKGLPGFGDPVGDPSSYLLRDSCEESGLVKMEKILQNEA